MFDENIGRLSTVNDIATQETYMEIAEAAKIMLNAINNNKAMHDAWVSSIETVIRDKLGGSVISDHQISDLAISIVDWIADAKNSSL